MKKLLLILTATIALTISGKSQITANVVIPDTAFKGYLVRDARINTNGDNQIQLSEATAFTDSIFISSNRNNINSQIADFTGIQAFTNLTGLFVIRNRADSLDLAANTQLKDVQVQIGNLVHINTIGLTNLKTLWLNGNKLTNLDLTTNDSITQLLLSDNHFSSLNFPVLPNLVFLRLDGNDSLQTVDFSNLDSLEFLDLSETPLIDTIDVRNKSKLTNLLLTNSDANFLKLQNTPSLRFLKAAGSGLDSIRLQDSPLLFDVDVRGPNLHHLDITNMANLSNLNASFGSLTSFVAGGNNRLLRLRLNDNNLTNTISLDTVSSLGIEIFLQNNSLTSLDFSKRRLRSINVSNNNLIQLNIKNGSNTIINNSSKFNATGNSNLTCIQVDDSTYSAMTWTNIDPQTSFDTNCNYITSLSEKEIKNKLTIYPNPSNGVFNISNIENIQSLEVYGMNGQKLEDVSIQAKAIDLFNHPNGIYFVRMMVRNEVITRKIIKQ